jgi:UDP-N-acetylglucosamine:LPS N-acetylglucosamine transferase
LSEASNKRRKILAVSSSGGHWTQLLRLRPAFEGHEVVFVTTQKNSESQVSPYRLYTIPDANRKSRIRLLIVMIRLFLIVLRERPDVVISTGAAPGYFALRFGKYLGARTLWLESIANAEEPSLSTQLVKSYADLLLTQWPHMARDGGPVYKGSVL